MSGKASRLRDGSDINIDFKALQVFDGVLLPVTV